MWAEGLFYWKPQLNASVHTKAINYSFRVASNEEGGKGEGVSLLTIIIAFYILKMLISSNVHKNTVFTFFRGLGDTLRGGGVPKIARKISKSPPP